MKTLYESIKSNIGIGKYAVIGKLKEWFEKRSEHSRAVYNYFPCDIDFEYEKDSDKFPTMVIKGPHSSKIKEFSFNFSDCENGELKAKLKSIKIDSKPSGYVNIILNRCELKDLKSLPEEAGDTLEFIGCDINKIDELPKGVKNLYFKYGHSLAGGRGCHIEEINNIKVDIINIEKVFNGKEGLVMNVTNFNNCTIGRIYLTSSVLDGWDTYHSRKISENAQEMLNEFVKRNNVKEIYFYPREGKVDLLKLKQDKNNVWHTEKA